MSCNFCDNDAAIEIVVFVDGEAKKIKLCPDCYREKMDEMMEQIPQEWGGAMLAEQLKAMLEKAEEAGGILQGMEFRIMKDELTNEPVLNIESTSITKDEFSIADEPIKKEGPKNAREKAFQDQLRILRKKRRELTRKLDQAFLEEDYESCAKYRDEIAEIGDQLVRINEERKDPYGV